MLIRDSGSGYRERRSLVRRMLGLRSVLLAVAVSSPPTVLAVRVDAVDGRRAVRVLATGEMPPAEVRREGDFVVVSLLAQVPPGFAPPRVEPPLQSISVDQGSPGAIIQVQVPADVPYEVRQEGTLLTLFFGEAAPPRSRVSMSNAGDLYRGLFPGAADAVGTEEAGQLVAPIDGGVSGGATDASEESPGLLIGPLRVQPSVSLSYLEGDNTVAETPEPVRHRYLEIQPRLVGELSLLQGRLKAGYEPRIRGYSTFPRLDATSHRAYANLDSPFGLLALRASHTLAIGVLETTEVDPGREYFFRLARFTRNQTTLGARMETGGRLDFDLAASRNAVRLDDEAAFFDHETEGLTGAVGYQVNAQLRAALGYSLERVPTPRERPEAASRSRTAFFQLGGEIAPLLSGAIAFGYRSQESPNAGEGGRAYRGLTLGASLTRELSRGTTVSLLGSRITPLSAFEQNAFYVSTSGQTAIDVSLPLSFSFRVGGGYQRNQYKTVASALGRPRDDRILGWTVGLGRGFGRRLYLRVDYRRERRDSNLDFFDGRTGGYSVQAGATLYPRVPRL